jgi:hypothetical protein
MGIRDRRVATTAKCFWKALMLITDILMPHQEHFCHTKNVGTSLSRDFFESLDRLWFMKDVFFGAFLEGWSGEE